MRPFEEPVYVTRPLMPSLERYMKLLGEVWHSHRLTNQGELHERLEGQLRELLDVPHLSLFSSGTTALVVALRSLDLHGEVITTPFTFCATTNAIALNGLTPVFCDVDPVTLNLDPCHAERLITSKTSAILAVHAYGVPCDVKAIDELARRRGLRVVYDAAAAFGEKVDGVPVGRFGDVSAFSFHATKLFSTAEGGCVTHNSPDLVAPIRALRNHGMEGEDDLVRTGVNGKLSELHSAFGLAALDEVETERALRREVVATYVRELEGVPGLSLVTGGAAGASSEQYLVIRIEPGEFGISRDELQDELNTFNVYPRRYYSPLTSQAVCYRSHPSADPENLAVATWAAREVLCLPLFGALGSDGAARIAEIIRTSRNGGTRR